MIYNVVVDKKVLEAFKRRAAKRFPVEYAESLWGKVEGNTAYIFLFADVEIDAKDTTDEMVVYDGEREKPEELEGASFLGTIHTHTHPEEGGAAPSEHDWAESYREGEALTGIAWVQQTKNRRRVRVTFWEPRKPIKVRYGR